MGKVLSLMIGCFVVAVSAIAQVPVGMNYQAIVRDGSGDVVTTGPISVDVTLSNGTSNYTETHNVTPNTFGLVNFIIGTGITGGDINTFDWTATPTTINVQVGSEVIGNQVLQSVPYSLYSSISDSVIGVDLAAIETVTASNGLTKTGVDIQMGGTLDNTVTVDMAGYELYYTNGNEYIVDATIKEFRDSDGTFQMGIEGGGVSIGTGSAPAILRYIDGNQGLGKVLTSDATGNGTWQIPALATSLSDTDLDTRIEVEEATDNDVITLYTNGVERMTIGTGGNVGIGAGENSYSFLDLTIDNTNTLQYRALDITQSYSGTSSKYGIYNNVTTDGTGQKYGMRNLVYGAASSNLIYGNFTTITPNTSSTGTMYGFRNYITQAGTGTRYGNYLDVRGHSSNTSSNYGEYIRMDHDGSGDQYGVYINSLGTTSGTEYGIYSTGADVNFLSGKTGLGIIAPVNVLDVEGGAVIGATYSGTNTAPTNGLLVAGHVGIGTTTTTAAPLTVKNSTTTGTSAAATTAAEFTGDNTWGTAVNITNTSSSSTWRVMTAGSNHPDLEPGSFAITDGNSSNYALTLNSVNGMTHLATSAGYTVALGYAPSDVSPTYKLQLPNSTTLANGRARANQWSTYSDNRVKFDQLKMQYGLIDLLKLVPKEYEHHDSKFVDGKLVVEDHFSRTIGFIAQEVYKVIPEAAEKPVDETKALWGLDYDKLIPVIVNAIKEEDVKVEVNKEDIAKLVGLVKLLEQQVKQQQAEINALKK